MRYNDKIVGCEFERVSALGYLATVSTGFSILSLLHFVDSNIFLKIVLKAQLQSIIRNKSWDKFNHTTIQSNGWQLPFERLTRNYRFWLIVRGTKREVQTEADSHYALLYTYIVYVPALRQSILNGSTNSTIPISSKTGPDSSWCLSLLCPSIGFLRKPSKLWDFWIKIIVRQKLQCLVQWRKMEKNQLNTCYHLNRDWIVTDYQCYQIAFSSEV